jgi:predicted aconitase with swiveling domain
VPGNVEGFAEVSRVGFNTCAAYVDLLITGIGSGVCHDRHSPDLYGRSLVDSILCIPQTVGSSSSVPLLMILSENRLAPKAMLFAHRIDPQAAGGILLGDIWQGQRIVVVDLLGIEFLNVVQTGDLLMVHDDGTVEVASPTDLPPVVDPPLMSGA